MVKVTGVTFTSGGKVYYFAPAKNAKYKKNTSVIVETARGTEVGTVVIPEKEVDEGKLVAALKPIIRVATSKDLETLKKNQEKKPQAMKVCEEKIAERGLDMKLIDCEFAFDGTKVIFYYTSPGRVDFRELVKDLSAIYRTRIELRQIGIRDEIKMIGGIAPCGRECCCASCMPDLKKVSVKMAKTQGLSLNPAKISGLCGRLMCCLAYESDYYLDAYKKMPKVGMEVKTPEGTGVVVNTNMLKMTVKVRIEDKAKDMMTYHDFALADLKFHGGKSVDDDEPLDDELKKIID